MRQSRRIWWGGGTLLGAWLVLAGTVSWPQVAAGLVATVSTLALVAFDARATGVRARLPRGWARGVRGLPADVARDVLTVTGEVVRRAAGRPGRSTLVAVPVPGRERDEVMLAIMGASATPNTVVVGYEPDADRLLVHQLRADDTPGSAVRDRLP